MAVTHARAPAARCALTRVLRAAALATALAGGLTTSSACVFFEPFPCAEDAHCPAGQVCAADGRCAPAGGESESESEGAGEGEGEGEGEGQGGLVLLSGGIASVGGERPALVVRAIFDDALEVGEQVCAGSRCVTGGIAP